MIEIVYLSEEQETKKQFVLLASQLTKSKILSPLFLSVHLKQQVGR